MSSPGPITRGDEPDVARCLRLRPGNRAENGRLGRDGGRVPLGQPVPDGVDEQRGRAVLTLDLPRRLDGSVHEDGADVVRDPAQSLAVVIADQPGAVGVDRAGRCRIRAGNGPASRQRDRAAPHRAGRTAFWVKNSDHPCDLRLRPIWPPVRSARIAFPVPRVRTPPPTELARSEVRGTQVFHGAAPHSGVRQPRKANRNDGHSLPELP